MDLPISFYIMISRENDRENIAAKIYAFASLYRMISGCNMLGGHIPYRLADSDRGPCLADLQTQEGCDVVTWRSQCIPQIRDPTRIQLVN